MNNIRERAIEMYRALEYRKKPGDNLEFSEPFLRKLYLSGHFFSLPVLLQVEECKQAWWLNKRVLSRTTNKALVCTIARMLTDDVDPRQVLKIMKINDPKQLARLEDDLHLRDAVILNLIQTFYLNPVFIYGSIQRPVIKLFVANENY